MPTLVRLRHETLGDGRFHVYTSPDVKGFHVTADSKAAAQREAVVVLDALASCRGTPPPEISFEDEAALQAA